MANTDYQSLMTTMYNQLLAIQEGFAKLATVSRVNTMQDSLQDQLDAISTRIETLTDDVQKLQNIIGDVLSELRSK